jgi:hypothetical protein
MVMDNKTASKKAGGKLFCIRKKSFAKVRDEG